MKATQLDKESKAKTQQKAQPQARVESLRGAKVKIVKKRREERAKSYQSFSVAPVASVAPAAPLLSDLAYESLGMPCREAVESKNFEPIRGIFYGIFISLYQIETTDEKPSSIGVGSGVYCLLGEASRFTR
ncbi:MAG: hypothetical protein IJ477_01375 [Alistipes sp.]|nr:hypothetical protein [Alistipes sp.]